MFGFVRLCSWAIVSPAGLAANAVAMLAHMVWLWAAVKLACLAAPVVPYSGSTTLAGAAVGAGVVLAGCTVFAAVATAAGAVGAPVAAATGFGAVGACLAGVVVALVLRAFFGMLKSTLVVASQCGQPAVIIHQIGSNMVYSLAIWCILYTVLV